MAQNNGSTSTAAELPLDEYSTGRVTDLLEKGDADALRLSDVVQQVRVRIDSGDEKGSDVTAQNAITTNQSKGYELAKGDRVVLVKTAAFDTPSYYVADLYRLPTLGLVLGIFIALVVIFSRWRGIMSIAGLAFSIAVLAGFIVPNILKGNDPLTYSIAGALAIVFVSLYLAHGFNKRTSVALLATIITLACAAALSVLFVTLARLVGNGSEESLYLQLGTGDAINLQGLLLGGIIIGTLGILDDITTAQVAAVDEIKKANSSLGFSELYRRGLSVGREHVSSLVNTLALAYAGASLPVFLLFFLNKGQPWWAVLNGEFIADEIVRTLVGSCALVLAVPISTVFAAYFFGKLPTKASPTRPNRPLP